MGLAPARETQGQNSQIKAGVRQPKTQKGAFADIYGSAHENSRESTQNVQREIANISAALNQSQEDLSNSMSILTGGVTLTHTQK